ncbi:MAG: hypothetical protein BRC41_07215 [Cyanobacteria bacterium QH_9_48_43]|nr:MAG: hypothetical protein BRC41_07215 [Cyanobacteria bacterium QH_9_48_43]
MLGLDVILTAVVGVVFIISSIRWLSELNKLPSEINSQLRQINRWLNKQALLSILGQLDKLAIIIALLTFILGEDSRHNTAVFQAWQTITTAEGQTGSGGRIEALEFLNSRPWRLPWIGLTEEEWFLDESTGECKRRDLPVLGSRWERQSLRNLSVPKAYLVEVKLCGANLAETNLKEAKLWKADLGGTDLWKSNLGRADLAEAHLGGTKLEKANLKGAQLWEANLKDANLEDANLEDANLENANLENANLSGVKNLTPTQVKSTCNWKQANFDEEFQKELEKEPDQKVNCSRWE